MRRDPWCFFFVREVSKVHASAQLSNDNCTPKIMFICVPFPSELYILYFSTLQFSVGLHVS